MPTDHQDNTTTSQSLIPTTTAKRARRICKADVEGIAQLVAKRLTETEACAVVGVPVKMWWQWKDRAKNKPEFEELLTRVRGSYIAANIQEMERAAKGKDGVRHDWRAADRLNGIVDPSRFSQTQQSPVSGPPTLAPVVNVWVSAAYARLQEDSAGQVIDVTATKQIEDKPADSQDDKRTDKPVANSAPAIEYNL